MAERPSLGWPERIAGLILIALVLVTGLRDLGFSLARWEEYGPVAAGDPLPDFEVELSDGTQLAAADLEGQVTLLTFWATWCHACGLEMPIIAAVEERFTGTDLRIYGVNRDDEPMPKRAEMVRAYAAERSLDFPHVYDDGHLARIFGVEAIPHLVLVDRRGEIRHVHMGRVGEDTLSEEIEALLTEK